jgi:hypothetical protein
VDLGDQEAVDVPSDSPTHVTWISINFHDTTEPVLPDSLFSNQKSQFG